MKTFGKWATLTVGALVASVILAVYGQSALQTIAGLAVAQTATQWNSVKDTAFGDNMTSGVLAAGCVLFDGTNSDRCRGDTTNGLDVDVTRLPSPVATTSFYSIKRVDIANSSVNLAFGFTSKKVSIEFPISNTDEVCVDWLGGTAVCPAANTAGDDRMAAGTSLVLDDFAGTSISVISSSGTQTVYVRAWN